MMSQWTPALRSPRPARRNAKPFRVAVLALLSTTVMALGLGGGDGSDRWTTLGTAQAAEIEGISFPESLPLPGMNEAPSPGSTDGPPATTTLNVSDASSLRLAGLGLLRYRVIFRGYVGGLYLPPSKTVSDWQSNVPKALELSYFWSIKGDLFGDAAVEILRRQHGDARIAKHQKTLDSLHALYRDVEPGDRYRLFYRPEVGMELLLNGRSLGVVPGADFAKDYFGIWLGGDPLDQAFRDALLAGR